MLKLLKNRRGEYYIDFLVSFFCLMTVLLMGMYIMSYAVTRQTVDAICADLLEVATITGCYGTDFEAEDSSLRNTYFDYDVVVDGDWYDDSESTVQLGHRMTVTVSYTTYLVGWMGLKLPVEISVTRQGLSQNYWK